MTAKTPADLVNEGVEILTEYLADHRTDDLRRLAPIIVDLRGAFRLGDGRADWSGRSPEYRQAMADLYTRARVPEDQLDTVQAALRYHVGNLIRERASAEELEAVGMTPTSPKERLANQRGALAAQREVAAPRQDVPRLAAFAQALIDYIDEDAIPDLPTERAVASRLALEAVQSRSAQLLVRLADARGTAPRQQEGGRHRRGRQLRGV